MKNHKVELAGTRFVIRSDVDEKRIRSIERFLNGKLKQVAGRGQKINFTDTLVLVLFHIADLMLDERDSVKRIKTDTAGEIRILRNAIEEVQGLVQQRLESTEDSIS
jgi:cell division protein ZapA (FtsZ GTPase activity inhibitor)